jgi:hypothetical protein
MKKKYFTLWNNDLWFGSCTMIYIQALGSTVEPLLYDAMY